jgi:hypothetical protein
MSIAAKRPGRNSLTEEAGSYLGGIRVNSAGGKMTSFALKVRSILQVSVMVAACAVAVPNGFAVCLLTGPTATYQFVGQCTDCTGTGVGVLTVRN